MEEKSTATLEKIQRAAMEEFSEKGFQGASLRQIVKQAGVTTGALYGYFSSKEALFASIVEPHAAALMGRFMEAQTSFAELPEQEQPEHMGLESSQCVHWMVDYICDHREPVKLLLCKAEGTSYEHLSTTWWRSKWNTPSNTWRFCTVWGMSPSSWMPSCATSSPAGCSMASLRSSSTTCPRSRPCTMWISCGISTLPGG